MGIHATKRFESKTEARTWALRHRHALNAAEVAGLSARAIAELAASPFYAEAGTLLTYIGSKQGELLTATLIERALADGKRVLAPVAYPDGVMVWSRLQDLAQLEMSALGILEPRADARDLVEPEGGLCIVPGVCFRHDGHRIGFGGGYYDRFLAEFTGAAIALSPEACFGVDFPVEPHDRPVSAVVTEATTHATSPTTSG